MPLSNTGILCWQGVATLICRKFLVPTRGLIWIMDEIRCWESWFLCGSLCHCATRGQHICSAILAYFLLFSICLEQGHSCELFKALDIVYKYAGGFFCGNSTHPTCSSCQPLWKTNESCNAVAADSTQIPHFKFILNISSLPFSACSWSLPAVPDVSTFKLHCAMAQWTQFIMPTRQGQVSIGMNYEAPPLCKIHV